MAEKEKDKKKSNSSSKTTKKATNKQSVDKTKETSGNSRKKEKSSEIGNKVTKKKASAKSDSKKAKTLEDKKGEEKKKSQSKATGNKEKNSLVRIFKVNKDKSKVKTVDKKNVSEAVKLYQKKKLQKQKAKKKFEGKFVVDIFDILIIVVVTAIISCVFTGIILNYQVRKSLHLVDSNIVSDKNVQEFLSTYSEIIDNYYEEINSEEMMKSAMEGMLNYLEDNYSIYLNEDDSDSLSEMLDGSYEGIGIVIRGTVIEDIYKNSPAEKAGLKSGDVIVGINDTKIGMNNYDEIGNLLKMDEDNAIVVKRNSEEITYKIKPSTVNIPSTKTDIIKSPDKKKNIGYITLNAFSSMAFEDFQESLMDLEENNIDSLIIDLRGNTGGYLNAATNIASLFLEEGKVIYSLESKNKITTYKDETREKRDYSIVILVNNSTASASEILTAALHDSYGATVVGKTTYGKGKVQTMKYYEDSIVKYTSAKWLRPNGDCIDEVGLVPDYEVDITISNNEVFDKQLDKAIELLSK